MNAIDELLACGCTSDFIVAFGGAGSGDYGHSGRKGEKGGSSKDGGKKKPKLDEVQVVGGEVPDNRSQGDKETYPRNIKDINTNTLFWGLMTGEGAIHDGVSDLTPLMHTLKNAGVTRSEAKDLMFKLWNGGALELKVINEVRSLSKDQRSWMPTAGDNVYAFAMWKDKSKAEPIIDAWKNNILKTMMSDLRNYGCDEAFIAAFYGTSAGAAKGWETRRGAKPSVDDIHAKVKNGSVTKEDLHKLTINDLKSIKIKIGLTGVAKNKSDLVNKIHDHSKSTSSSSAPSYADIKSARLKHAGPLTEADSEFSKELRRMGASDEFVLSFAEAEGDWITIGGTDGNKGEKHVGGFPVLIKDGQIQGGQRAKSLGLHGKQISDVKTHLDKVNEQVKSGKSLPDAVSHLTKASGTATVSDVGKTSQSTGEKAMKYSFISAGEMVMTKEAAERCRDLLEPMWSGRSSFGPGVKVEPWGAGWQVILRGTSKGAGNLHRYAVGFLPKDEGEAKMVVKSAQGKASQRDKESLARIAADLQSEKE